MILDMKARGPLGQWKLSTDYAETQPQYLIIKETEV